MLELVEHNAGLAVDDYTGKSGISPLKGAE